MRFLIYIPGDDRTDTAKLAAVGLASLTDGCSMIGTPSGPDGKPGVVFSWPTSDPRSLMGYRAEIQEWIPAEAAGDYPEKRYWVGFVKGLPPTPQDLAKSLILEGDDDSRGTLLGDGNMWVIPAAGMLPKRSRYTSKGWGWEVIQQFEAYWNESCKWYLELSTKQMDENRKMTVGADCCEYLTRALSLNYMLTPEVVSHLGLFNTLTIGPALKATIHGITIRQEADQKKTVDTLLAT